MKINVMDTWAVMVEDDTLRQNSTKIYDVEFNFDKCWDGYSKTVIFEAGPASVIVALDNDRCSIPSECLKHGSVKLQIGIYGVKGDERKGTIWCLASMIIPDATISMGSSSGSPLPDDVYSEIMAAIGDLSAAGFEGKTLAEVFREIKNSVCETATDEEVSDAAAFLDKVMANPIANLPIGRERYTTMLDEKAEIIDDVVVFHTEENAFWVSTLFRRDMIAWFDTHMEGYDITYQDITGRYHMYAVQGPRSMEMVNSLVEVPINGLRFFSFRSNSIDGIPVIINRAGFTGEKVGYEIYVAPDKCDEMEAKLAAAAERVGGREVTEFQIMAWTLPTEAGFYYMRDLRRCNPLEVGLDKGIDWNKDFIGKAALQKIKEDGIEREMVGFFVEEADVQIHGRHLGGPGHPVMLNGEEVGRVFKFTYSYCLDKNIGYILARKGAVKVGDHVAIHHHDAVITVKPFI